MIIGVGVTDAGALFDAAGGVLSRAINHGEVGTHDVAGVYEVEDGKIKEIVVTKPGSGYSTPPGAVVKGMERVDLMVKILFDKDLKKNGAVSSIEVAPTE